MTTVLIIIGSLAVGIVAGIGYVYWIMLRHYLKGGSSIG